MLILHAVVQRTQSVPRRGARPVLERMSADACRHPHTRAVNRVGARLLRYLWRGRPHLESGGFRFSRVVSRHILWLEGWTTDSHKKRGPFASCMLCWGSSRTGGVQLLAQFLLSVRVNCRRGAFVGIEGDSPLGLSSHIRHVWRLVCLQCACMYAHPSSAS